MFVELIPLVPDILVVMADFGATAIVMAVIAIASAAASAEQQKMAAKKGEQAERRAASREERISSARALRKSRIRAAQLEAAGAGGGVSGATITGGVASATSFGLAQTEQNAALAGMRMDVASDVAKAKEVAAITSFVGTAAKAGMSVSGGGSTAGDEFNFNEQLASLK